MVMGLGWVLPCVGHGLHGWNFPPAPKDVAPRLLVILPRCKEEAKEE